MMGDWRLISQGMVTSWPTIWRERNKEQLWRNRHWSQSKVFLVHSCTQQFTIPAIRSGPHGQTITDHFFQFVT